MNLEEMYYKVNNIIQTIDFSILWPNFKPLKFALYTSDECFFNGEYITKTEQFLGNTATFYNGEYIAIWNVLEDIPVEILVSKMVHEMFHGFQMQNHESRFANELLALEEYQYLDENLSLKYLESQLLINLINDYQDNMYQQLLAIRKYRYLNYKNEFLYESKIEQIEGTANYIELMVLNQISLVAFNNKLKQMEKDLLNKNNYLPIRIISYDIGTMLLFILNKYNLKFDSSFGDIPFSLSLLTNLSAFRPTIEFNFASTINDYYSNAKKIIDKAIKQNNIVLEGSYELTGVNVYNAIYLKPYIISEYFVMYKDQNEDKVLYGDFVIEENKLMITKIYQLK